MATSLNNKSSMVHDFSVKLNVQLKPYKLITSNNAPSQQKNILKSIIQLIDIREVETNLLSLPQAQKSE